jgi:NAD-dependent dihydropyrimidine dehydrogenase PreA subunit
MDKRKAHFTVDAAKCAPCSGLICIGVCPEGVLEPGKEKRPELVDLTGCTVCGVCVNLCPAKAIKVERSEESKDKPR